MARHKEFDPDAALEAAVRIFWARGFEATSVQDLVDGMGIGRRSLYDTFGDKSALFTRVLDRYIERHNAVQADLLDQTLPAGTALRALFESSIREPMGCLVVNSAAEASVKTPTVASMVQGHFAYSIDTIRHLVRRGQAAGEFTSALPAQSLAETLHNAWIGLRVQTRTGAPTEALSRMIDGMVELAG